MQRHCPGIQAVIPVSRGRSVLVPEANTLASTLISLTFREPFSVTSLPSHSAVFSFGLGFSDRAHRLINRNASSSPFPPNIAPVLPTYGSPEHSQYLGNLVLLLPQMVHEKTSRLEEGDTSREKLTKT